MVYATYTETPSEALWNLASTPLVFRPGLPPGGVLRPNPRKLGPLSKSSSDLPSNWTKDMNKFYNEVDETYLDVDLKQVLAKLPQDKEYWRIDRTDVYGQSQGKTILV